MQTSTLLYAADSTRLGLRSDALARAAHRGDLHRVARGVYLAAEEWAELDPIDRYRARIAAVSTPLREGLVLSHDSAAALWDFPVLDEWPPQVHLLDPARSTGKRSRLVVRHPAAAALLSPDDLTSIDGLVCTSAPRTAVDIALSQGFVAATMMFDDGLRRGLFTLDEIDRFLSRRPRARRRRDAFAALRIASALSATAGESISKAEMHLLGFPRAVLQKRFDHRDGTCSYADFWWEKWGLVGEFDGAWKYLDASRRSGRSVEQCMLDEKARDERLSEQPGVRRVVHWNYATARNPFALAERLLAAGLPRLGPGVR
ncbi:type IV toxin-antitoxin system AbiEi family antitoxin domain-containing protein [Frondihabitans cladoniiphilus]